MHISKITIIPREPQALHASTCPFQTALATRKGDWNLAHFARSHPPECTLWVGWILWRGNGSRWPGPWLKGGPVRPQLLGGPATLGYMEVISLMCWCVGVLTVWVSEWVNEWISEWVCDWVIEWLNDWMTEFVSLWVSDWINEWVSNWISEWICTWIDNEQSSQSLI
jgi:hypothetical protein